MFCVGNIFDLLKDGLHSVCDTNFIDVFKDKFLTDILACNKHRLKDIRNQQNPLFCLINIDKQQKKQNTLVKMLIALAASLIEIHEDETLCDAFYRPSWDTLTYAILFDESLNSLPIYAQTINHLNTQWKKWKANGALVDDIWKWKGFSREQMDVVRKIWTSVNQVAGETVQIDRLFDVNYREMQAKLEMNEKVVTCLNSYCQHADDKDKYYELVKKWQNRFRQEAVQSIEMPNLLQDILPFAEKLNQYANVHSWRAFLNQRTTNNCKI